MKTKLKKKKKKSNHYFINTLLADTLRNDTYRQYFNDDFLKYSPVYFLYERETPKSKEASAAIRSFYFENKTLEFPHSVKAFGELYADGLIGFEYYRFLQMVSKYIPVYTYFFTYKGRYSHFVDPQTNKTLGKFNWEVSILISIH